MYNITVVIPTYNRQLLLKRALNSAICQSYKPHEIIVIDDGSTDETKKQIKQHYPEIRYILQNHSGVSAARNVGIQNAKSEWIAFLDDDDEWDKQKLRIQINSLKKQTEYLIAHTDEKWIRNGNRINQKEIHKKKGGYIFNDCLPLCIISPSSVILHKNIFKKIGLFDESLPACEDYDLWLRICSKYHVLYIDQELVIKHGGHEDQLSKKYWGMDRFRIKALSNIINKGNLEKDENESAIRMMHEKINIYQNGAKKNKNKIAATEFLHLQNQYPLNQ